MRSHHTGIRLGFFLSLLLSCLLASVQAETLNKPTIEKWLKAGPVLAEFGKKHQAELTKHEIQTDPMDMSENFKPERMLQPLKASGLYDEAEDLVEDYGFGSLEDWALTTGQIAKAYFALQAGDEMQKMAPQMEAQMQQMMQDPSLTPEMKAMMQQSMNMGKSMMKMAEDVPEADKKAIQPYLPQINHLFEEMGAEENP